MTATRSPTAQAFLSGTFARELVATREARARGDILDCSHCGADCDPESVDRYGEPLCNDCADE